MNPELRDNLETGACVAAIVGSLLLIGFWMLSTPEPQPRAAATAPISKRVTP